MDGNQSVRQIKRTIPNLTTNRNKPLEHFVRKEENAGKQCFLLFQKRISVFESRLFCRLQKLSILDRCTGVGRLQLQSSVKNFERWLSLLA